MFNAKELFQNRLNQHFKETSRYLKYIFNGHIAVALLFLISAIAVYYQQVLQYVPDNFPTAWLMAALLGGMITFIPVRTFLQEADLVFLTPAEHKMKAFFNNALIYSYVIYSFFTVFLIAAFSPLYFHSYPEQTGLGFLSIIFLLFLLQGWNLLANWWMLRLENLRRKTIDQLTRLIATIIMLYFLFAGEHLFAVATAIISLILLIYEFSLGKKHLKIAWEQLVMRDRYRMQFFYQIANMFTEVPHIKSKVKKRTFLVNLLNRFAFEKKHTFDYLYHITFIRSGDYFGMYLRLTIIGSFIIYFISNDLLTIVFASLFLYLTSFQMVPLAFHYRMNIWLDLYPVDKTLQQKSFCTLIIRLILIQTVIFSLFFLISGKYFPAGIILLLGSAFSFLFTQYYVRRKLKTI